MYFGHTGMHTDKNLQTGNQIGRKTGRKTEVEMLLFQRVTDDL